MAGADQEGVHHQAHGQHADEWRRYGLAICRNVLARLQPADEPCRGDPKQRTQQGKQKRDRSVAARGGLAGNANAGRMPKNNLPMKVAVPVASATGRKVRTLTSGIINSIANITPPRGVLNVAAMPAPAPAATSVMRCQVPCE